MKTTTCRECLEKKQHYALGVCNKCYKRLYKITAICSSCGRKMKIAHKGKMLCETCYRKSQPKKPCKKCGKNRPVKGRGLCVSCLTTENIKTLLPKICVECGRADRKIRKGLCRKCYKHEWNQKNMAHILEYNKEWNEAHPERRKATLRRYDISENGRIVNLLNTHKRLDRISENGGKGLTPEEWEEIKKEHNYRCYYCGEKKKLEIEHKIPVSRGGKLERNNIVPSCKLCNRKKGTMTEKEFLAKVALAI